MKYYNKYIGGSKLTESLGARLVEGESVGSKVGLAVGTVLSPITMTSAMFSFPNTVLYTLTYLPIVLRGKLISWSSKLLVMGRLSTTTLFSSRICTTELSSLFEQQSDRLRIRTWPMICVVPRFTIHHGLALSHVCWTEPSPHRWAILPSWAFQAPPP